MLLRENISDKKDVVYQNSNATSHSYQILWRLNVSQERMSSRPLDFHISFQDV